jgi:uncharacterized membrane protein SpoIIM required for sporulation
MFMVLEAMLDPRKAEDKPLHVFLISLLFSFIGLFLAYNLFPSQSSILSVAFVTIFFVPFFQQLFDVEEQKDEELARKKAPSRENNFVMRHRKVVFAYSAFFMGVILVYSFAFIFFPSIRDLFALQMDWFRVQGIAAIQPGSFERYFFNNTQVMVLFFILSVLFGAGAIFILVWNASVIAVFLGIIANKFYPTLGATAAYLYGVGIGLSSIALHGIPEIGGYFFAGVAGGILSAGLVKEQFMSKEFQEVAKDSIIWLSIGEALVVVGAFLEAVF